MIDSSLNFVALVENNPITRLNNEYNNKFINKIKEIFTETQQYLFVSSFYCYLNHHPTNDFVINLDNIWNWLGFSQKANAKTCLEKHFVIEKDYKFLLMQSQEQDKTKHGGHNKQTILLSINTFKLFCIKAETKKANEIHEYFVKLEELLQQIVQEESNELKNQLEKLENRLLESEEGKKKKEEELQKQKEENELLQKTNREVPMIYVYNTDARQADTIVKIGISNHLNARMKSYKTSHPYGKLEFYKEIDIAHDLHLFEKMIHDKLTFLRVKHEMFRMSVDEAVMCITNEYNNIKLLQNTTESERKSKIQKIYEYTNKIINDEPEVPNKVTFEQSTQTDFNEMDPMTVQIIHGNPELLKKFDNFIENHCIVRADVEISAKDIMGVYRLQAREAIKEVTHAFNDYLRRRFKYDRLQAQDADQVVLGFIGVTLKKQEYKKSESASEEETFVFEKCVFTPAGTALSKDIVEEYKDWKRIMKKPWDEKNDSIRLKTFLKACPYVLFETVWTTSGNGQGFYGIKLKRDVKYHRTSSTGCKIFKKDMNNHVLCEYATIAKAAETEKMCPAKMSRSVKNRVIFHGDAGDYFYTKVNEI
jgi:phage anti-repressor protein